LLRIHLRKYKLLYQAEPTGPPSAEEIKAFNKEDTGGPSLADPRLDWGSPFSSPWNHELISLLALDFIPILQSVKRLNFPPEMMDEKFIQKRIAAKLVRSREDYRDNLPPDLESNETAPAKSLRVLAKKSERKRKGRRNRRRNTVNMHL
jgi:hypothetical protein